MGGHQPGNTSESDDVEDLSSANQQTESHRDDKGKGELDKPNDGDREGKSLLHGVKLGLDTGNTELTQLTMYTLLRRVKLSHRRRSK
jgi:hypothetical protein